MTDQEPTQLTLAGDEKPKTKYTFVSTDNGCLIQREGGFECGYEYHDTFIRVNGKPLGVYIYKVHLQAVAETFASWVSTGRSKSAYYECVEMIARALNSRLLGQWKRIVRYLVPPEIEELSRKMFSSVVGDAVVLHIPALYTDEWKHLRADLNKYAACRMYAKYACEVHETMEDVVTAQHRPERLLERASRWRQALTPAVPYKALNKTLDSISWGISWKHLHRLSTMRLENPITTRLHLAFALAASDHHNWGMHERIVLAASDQAVIEAGQVMNYAVTTRTRKDSLIELSHQILDYPEPYGGDLVGLARRSHEWHEEDRARWRRRLDALDNDAVAGLPNYGPAGRLESDTPLPLAALDYDKLAEEGITPLRTAGDCYKEHDLMGHCVHTYATKAQYGGCFLFHVEHTSPEGVRSMATVEVLPDGTIGQAEGPDRDKNNGACRHGIQRLRWAWGTMVKGQVL